MVQKRKPAPPKKVVSRKLTDKQIEQRLIKLKNLYNLVKDDMSEDLTVEFPSIINGVIKIGRDEVINDIIKAKSDYLNTTSTVTAQQAEYYNNIFDVLKKVYYN